MHPTKTHLGSRDPAVLHGVCCADLFVADPIGLLFCRHHARVHADGLIAAGARLSFIGQQD
jgi:hypothetical protein